MVSRCPIWLFCKSREWAMKFHYVAFFSVVLFIFLKSDCYEITTHTWQYLVYYVLTKLFLIDQLHMYIINHFIWNIKCPHSISDVLQAEAESAQMNIIESNCSTEPNKISKKNSSTQSTKISKKNISTEGTKITKTKLNNEGTKYQKWATQ